ncbi:DUF2066 domain-containing protein [Nitrococcus mobilis]|uniref:DUF2066 domain-containing protein n=1 Tax=Nitrococcus mobilis Nb-231 TaxID=314278 RepID=A4BSN6_9GAMM|nr:DUF2066 domain-containing protein [Nitrococcus mobilis]EAR21306.1 hypothetical protein NB231_08615 [Nitrococcus mobilis Nb-231]
MRAVVEYASEGGKAMGAGLMARVFIVCIGLTLLYAGSSRTACGQDLPTARVAVTDQSAGARAEALRAAITQVLVRLTGRADIAHAAPVASLMTSPQPYLQQYHYEHGEGGRLELITRFDGQSLRRVLIQRGIPIWQAARPPVLVWFAFDSNGEQELVNAAAGSQLHEALSRAVAELGIPVIFPLLDSQDRQRVSYSDVADGFSEPVLAASRRYSTELVLILRITRSRSGNWQGRWSLYQDDSNSSWESGGVSIEQALAQGVPVLAARLRSSYTLLPDLAASSRLQIRIGGVDSLERFAALEELLTSLPGVAAIHLRRAEAEWVSIKLSLNVARSQIEQELAHHPRLESSAPLPLASSDGSAADNPSSAQSELTYRLIR